MRCPGKAVWPRETWKARAERLSHLYGLDVLINSVEVGNLRHHPLHPEVVEHIRTVRGTPAADLLLRMPMYRARRRALSWLFDEQESYLLTPLVDPADCRCSDCCANTAKGDVRGHAVRCRGPRAA